jgi:signal transduction histidine kinase
VTLTDRQGLAARAFCLATLAGLGLAFGVAETLLGAAVLALVGAVAVAATHDSRVPVRWVCAAEGLVAALVVGSLLPEGALLLPYLVIPALLTGVADRYAAVVTVVGLEMLGLLVVLGVDGGAVRAALETAAPWAVASLGVGLMAVWVGDLRNPPARDDEASYESARRLLSQLRTVARRLSSGLDPVSLASQVVLTTHEALEDTRTAIFVRTEGGLLAPLGYQGYHASEALLPTGPMVDRCWAEMEPVHEQPDAGLVDTRHRFVLPLRSGSRMIGVVLSEAGSPPAPGVVAALMADLDEQALRLDTALVFDEVRSLATTEERQRLAREIHDGVAQELASLGYAVDDLVAENDDEHQRSRLRALRAEITRVVSELRLSIFDLRSGISTAAGLGSALSDYVRAVGARSGFTVHLTLDEAPTRLRVEVETELLRIAQEAVTNARKHAEAGHLWVDCQVRPPYAQVTVEDDGHGMGQPREDSYGFTIMRERARRINARLEIGPRDPGDPSRGTKVRVTVGGETDPDVEVRRRDRS